MQDILGEIIIIISWIQINNTQDEQSFTRTIKDQGCAVKT